MNNKSKIRKKKSKVDKLSGQNNRTMKSQSILKLNSTDARLFFLKNESYCNIELPEYINFQRILKSLSNEIAEKNLNEICHNYKTDKPSEYEDVNHTLLSNKDGRFSWRPLKLIHPALYVLLVHQITNNNNWSTIINRLTRISIRIRTHIECKSLPKISLTSESDKAVQVNSWWQEIEQASLKISIEFGCIIHADITDCYGSIYTHSIPWAIHGKKLAKEKRKDSSLIGNTIDSILQNMAYGQTNGIPQGTVLMDFLAEMVLSYVDLICYTELKISNYKIIRYRDDYRIFTQSEVDGLTVLKVLTEVLAGLGMKLNASKTVISTNLIKDSIKPDKWFLLDNTVRHRGLQKQLMFIHKLSGFYPNSGSIKKELLEFYKRLHKRKYMNEDISVLIFIASDIAYRNPSTYANIAEILSKFICFLDNNDKSDIFNKITKRFGSIPNTGLIDIWLQRITVANDGLSPPSFKEPLCTIVAAKGLTEDNRLLWELDWLQQKFQNILKTTSIIDAEKLSDIKQVIDINEISLFEDRYY